MPIMVLLLQTIMVEMGLNKEGKIPIEVLFDPDYKVLQGDRNNELIRVAN